MKALKNFVKLNYPDNPLIYFLSCETLEVKEVSKLDS